jgi:hypothetical protein
VTGLVTSRTVLIIDPAAVAHDARAVEDEDFRLARDVEASHQRLVDVAQQEIFEAKFCRVPIGVRIDADDGDAAGAEVALNLVQLRRVLASDGAFVADECENDDRTLVPLAQRAKLAAGVGQFETDGERSDDGEPEWHEEV